MSIKCWFVNDVDFIYLLNIGNMNMVWGILLYVFQVDYKYIEKYE